MVDRLKVFEDKLNDVVERVEKVEKQVSTIKNDFLSFDAKLDSIFAYVAGFDKVLGFTKRNWKTAITFGAGIMTAAGIGNPQVNAFIANFFGG